MSIENILGMHFILWLLLFFIIFFSKFCSIYFVFLFTSCCFIYLFFASFQRVLKFVLGKCVFCSFWPFFIFCLFYFFNQTKNNFMCCFFPSSFIIICLEYIFTQMIHHPSIHPQYHRHRDRC